LAPYLINVKKCDYHMAYDTITKYHSITANWQYRDKQMVLEWPDDTSDLKIICDNIITLHYIQTEHNWSHTYHNIILWIMKYYRFSRRRKNHCILCKKQNTYFIYLLYFPSYNIPAKQTML
jgi:hypothetical protein